MVLNLFGIDLELVKQKEDIFLSLRDFLQTLKSSNFQNYLRSFAKCSNFAVVLIFLWQISKQEQK